LKLAGTLGTARAMPARFTAVIFDFGGVITTSPFAAFAELERRHGAPAGSIRAINARDPDSNAWARFERAEIDAAAFDMAFAAEARAAGVAIPGHEVIAALAARVRPRMVAAMDALKAAGFKLGCITNNVTADPITGAGRAAEVADALARFDHVIESSKVGLRKPDPRIYTMMCDTLGVAPAACVYLDDLGVNCKPAAALGMHAIKVVDEDQAIADLARATGIAV
jgi:putative hydrolase of the HAD superfamily